MPGASKQAGSNMKHLCVALALGLASMASAQESVRLLPTPIELPTRIGPLQFDGKPHKYEPAALGTAYQYNGVGLSLTVYVYDAGIADIPDGGDSVANCHLFEQAKREIASAGYSEVRLISEQLARLSPPRDTPLAREAVFEFVRSGQPTISYIWMTGVSKHVIKVRFSMGVNQRHEAESARRFLLTTLGEAVMPHLTSVDPAGENPKASLNVFVDTDSDDVAAAITYLTLLSVQAEKVPGSKPLCGGEFVPTYDAELSAFKAVLALNPESEAGKFGKQLSAATKAGFLDELVWVEMHRDAWGNVTPDGLTLSEYKSWKKRNLKGFKPPRWGSVVINQPRPMRVEPPDDP
jgi:hypothetical protein